MLEAKHVYILVRFRALYPKQLRANFVCAQICMKIN